MRKFLIIGAVAAVSLMAASAASAATVTVTPTNTQGWATNDTTAGGQVNFVQDSTAPAGVGALQLKTDATTTAKAQYVHATATPLAQVSDLSYQTKQNAGTLGVADPAYQLITCLGGATPSSCTGFTTLNYEPYQGGGGTVLTGTWQSWDVDAGGFWSTRGYAGCSPAVVGTSGGPATYTLAALKTACPNAVVIGFGVNIGSNTPNWDVETDLVQFNDTTYDFEPYEVATDKDQCKKDGWKDVKRANGSSFKNQGDCIQYVNTGK
jgi:hypothetical protein